MDIDFVLADDDAFGDVFDDFAFFVGLEFRPAGIEVSGFGEDLVTGEVLDFEEVNLSLKFRDLIIYLFESFIQGTVLTTVDFYRDLVVDVGPVDLLHLPLDLLPFFFMSLYDFFLVLDHVVGAV